MGSQPERVFANKSAPSEMSFFIVIRFPRYAALPAIRSLVQSTSASALRIRESDFFGAPALLAS